MSPKKEKKKKKTEGKEVVWALGIKEKKFIR